MSVHGVNGVSDKIIYLRRSLACLGCLVAVDQVAWADPSALATVEAASFLAASGFAAS